MKVEKEEDAVAFDPYNSDLNLVIDASGYSAHPLTNEGFAFMWAGARATHGINKGKICFEVKVVEHIDVSHLPADEPNPHVVRVGFSAESTSMQLGEEPLSYGYGGTGKISTNCQFKSYGQPFQLDDVILALLNMDADHTEIGFAKNGQFLGWAYKVDKQELQDKALFPHVLTKNCAFEVNFGQKEKPFFNLPEGFQDFKFISELPSDLRVRGTKAPEKREDCEMIMMCGLPGAGKTVWAGEYAAKHPEKKYNVLGTNNIIDKMKVMGLPRKRNYHGRWDVLIQMATKCLNKLFEIGSKLRRNYILDQTNVYPTAQRRKMRNFDGFKRKAVVVVPTDEEFKRRCEKREKEEGKDVPDQAVLEMKANFKLPEVGDIFDEVIFTEVQQDEAEELVKKYNEEGRAAVGPANKRFRPNEQSSGVGRGGRNSGPEFRGSRDRSNDRGRGGFNSPGPRNSWNDGPQSGFGRRSPPRGGFGGPRGFEGSPGGARGGSGSQGGRPAIGYGGGSPGFNDNRSPSGFGRGVPRGGFGGRAGFGGNRDPGYNDGFGGPDSDGGYARDSGYGGGYGNDSRGGYGSGYGPSGGFNEGRGSGYTDSASYGKRNYEGKNDSPSGYGAGYNNRGGRRGGGFGDRGGYGRGEVAAGSSGFNDSGFGGTRGGGRGYSNSNRGYSATAGRQGSGYRAGANNNASRWHNDTNQPPTQSDQVSSQSQGGYAGYGSVKPESMPSGSVSSTYPGYNQSYSNYSSSASSGYQSYGYQPQAAPTAASSQQWGAVSSTTGPQGHQTAIGQGPSNQYQPQWGQYYQQPPYNQYYGQQGGGATSTYGQGSYAGK